MQIVPGFRLERLRQRVTETLDLGTGSATGGPPGGANGTLGDRRNIDTVALWGVAPLVAGWLRIVRSEIG